MTSVARLTVAQSPVLRDSAQNRSRPRSGCYRQRYRSAFGEKIPQVPRVRAVSSSIDAPNRNESTNHSSDISKPDLLRTSAAVRLASYVYKQGSVEPWVNNDGFVLRAQGNTECTRWFVCDKLCDGDDETAAIDDEASGTTSSEKTKAKTRKNLTVAQRWFVVRGAAWNDESVNRVKLSAQISKAWPVALHPGVPVVCHAGVAEMTEEFWNEIEPWLVSLPQTAQACFTGHSLGGSMATILMAWAHHRCSVPTRRIEPALTFGSPPVIAADGWALRTKGRDEGLERLARSLALGGDWVGELSSAVGLVGTFGGFGLGDAVAGGGGSRRNGNDANSVTVEHEEDTELVSSNPCALRLAGFSAGSVRAFVLHNDPVPRMWLASDPVFQNAVRNETVVSMLNAREFFFGTGVFTKNRFLYEAVGTLYWLKWSPSGGTSMTVHEHDDGDEYHTKDAEFPLMDAEYLTKDAVAAASSEASDKSNSTLVNASNSAEVLNAALHKNIQKKRAPGHVNRLTLRPVWETDVFETVRGAFDHNAGNYVDAVQWLALKRLVRSGSVNL
mmetsp:Transcript_6028/g.22785  ORF Transcript_6028/g.22785 Transcript_6028/m.22785 type:complete len:557 (-) Transcript_6028:2879-4549(-)